MQILEPSRPIPKCEHFHVDIRAQKQALGNVYVYSLRVRACACVCMRVWNCMRVLLHSWRLLCACV